MTDNRVSASLKRWKIILICFVLASLCRMASSQSEGEKKTAEFVDNVFTQCLGDASDTYYFGPIYRPAMKCSRGYDFPEQGCRSVLKFVAAQFQYVPDSPGGHQLYEDQYSGDVVITFRNSSERLITLGAWGEWSSPSDNMPSTRLVVGRISKRGAEWSWQIANDFQPLGIFSSIGPPGSELTVEKAFKNKATCSDLLNAKPHQSVDAELPSQPRPKVGDDGFNFFSSTLLRDRQFKGSSDDFAATFPDSAMRILSASGLSAGNYRKEIAFIADAVQKCAKVTPHEIESKDPFYEVCIKSVTDVTEKAGLPSNPSQRHLFFGAYQEYGKSWSDGRGVPIEVRMERKPNDFSSGANDQGGDYEAGYFPNSTYKGGTRLRSDYLVFHADILPLHSRGDAIERARDGNRSQSKSQLPEIAVRATELVKEKKYSQALPLLEKICADEIYPKENCYIEAEIYHQALDGVPQDLPHAAILLAKSCGLGSGLACNSLGLLYSQGGEGVPQDLNRALELFSKNCSLRSANSCTNAGYLYAQGVGVGKDVSKARKFYKKGCSLGNKAACDEVPKLQ